MVAAAAVEGALPYLVGCRKPSARANNAVLAKSTLSLAAPNLHRQLSVCMQVLCGLVHFANASLRR